MTLQQQLLDDIIVKLTDSPTIIMKYVEALKTKDIEEGKKILEKMKFKITSLDWEQRRQERFVDFNRWLATDFKGVEEVNDFRDLKAGERVLILFTEEFIFDRFKEIDSGKCMSHASLTTCFIKISKIEYFPEDVVIDYAIEKLPFTPYDRGYTNFVGAFTFRDKETKSEKYECIFGKWFIHDKEKETNREYLTKIYRFLSHVKFD